MDSERRESWFSGPLAITILNHCNRGYDDTSNNTVIKETSTFAFKDEKTIREAWTAMCVGRMDGTSDTERG